MSKIFMREAEKLTVADVVQGIGELTYGKCVDTGDLVSYITDYRVIDSDILEVHMDNGDVYELICKKKIT